MHTNHVLGFCVEQDFGFLPHHFWLGLSLSCGGENGQDLILYFIHQEFINRMKNRKWSEG